MKPGQFIYHAPKTVSEATRILAEVAPQDGMVLAGGQSLVPAMAFRVALPAHLVDINRVSDFAPLRVVGSDLEIGARVRHAAFHRPVTQGPLGSLLTYVVRHIAHYPIRTRGTFCGSLANADPASEWCLVAATLGASMQVRGTRSDRSVAAADFFQSIMTTALTEGELLAGVRLPVPSDDTHWGFYEFNRRTGDFAIAMCLVTYRLERGRIVEPRVGIGGVEDYPRRIAAAEAVLRDQPAGADVFAAAADAAAKALTPSSGAPEVTSYKRQIARTAVQRALEAADARR